MSGKHFEKAPAHLAHEIESVMQTYHPRLLQPTLPVSVTVEALLAYGPRSKEGELKSPAITVRGTPALACIRITKLEERVAGRADAVMWIDGDQWKEWCNATLRALVDHELTHLDIAYDPRSGEMVFDDAERVRLRMRAHDFEVGWFDEVAERHAEDSVEVQQATKLANGRQMYFPGFDIIPKKQRKRRA